MIKIKPLPRGIDLAVKAQEYNIPVFSNNGVIDEKELQMRLLEVERAHRESSLWLIALISGIASVISALAAWAAILLAN